MFIVHTNPFPPQRRWRRYAASLWRWIRATLAGPPAPDKPEPPSPLPIARRLREGALLSCGTVVAYGRRAA